MVFGSWKTLAPKTSSLQPPCEVFGNIYFVTQSKNADYVIFVQTEEAFADVVIYKEEEFAYADRSGHWYVTEDILLSDSRVFITENIAEADFTIAYTETESFAGCDQ